MPNISYAGCPRLSWMVSAQFILEICIAAKNRWKFAKTPIFGVQGRSRSSMLVPLESSSTVLAMISSKSVSICNRFHARWANSGKITNSKGRTPLWCPRSRGISSSMIQRHQIISLEARDSRLSYGENPESLSDLGLIWYLVVTPQTEGPTSASNLGTSFKTRDFCYCRLILYENGCR